MAKAHIAFVIPWQVQPKQADRAVRAGAFIRHYQPKRVTDNAKALILLAAQHAPKEPMKGPLRLAVTFEFPWRKSDSKKRRANGPKWKDTKPDADNCLKQILDCLEAAGFFSNDSQIAWLIACKIYCGRGRTLVEIEELE